MMLSKDMHSPERHEARSSSNAKYAILKTSLNTVDTFHKKLLFASCSMHISALLYR